MRSRLTAFLLLAAPAVLHAQAARTDEWLQRPVEQGTFEAFTDFFVYDANVPFETRTLEVWEKDGIRRESLSFQSTPGMRVTANYYRTITARSERRPTVIFLHGGVAAGKDNFHPLAMDIVRGGINVLAIDMLHFGARKTALLTEFTEQSKHERLYNQPATFLSWVTQTVKDTGRSFDFLVRERGADASRIGLFGFSRGGQVGIIAGGVDNRLKAVAIAYAGHFDRAETGHRAAACPANYIGRIAPRPLYLINGEFDSDYIKDVSVVPLHRHAPHATVDWVETGHQVPPADAVARLLTWLRAQL